jgi:hypothetical protein
MSFSDQRRRNMKTNKHLIAAGLFIALGGAEFASAQDMSAMILSNDLRVTPTSPGTQDYYYEQGQNAPIDTLTDFSLTTLAPDVYNPENTGNSKYALLTTQNSLTTFETGIAYQGANTGSEPFTLATFTSDVPDFTVSILQGNTDGKGISDIRLTLLINGVAVANSFLNTSSSNTMTLSDVDEFGQFVVADASPADVFSIDATSSSKSKFDEGTYLGGVTFTVNAPPAPTSVPEPSVWLLLSLTGLGSFVLSGLRRYCLSV